MSGGGRVFPSITGGGLTRATAAVLEADLARRQRELQERQISIAERTQALNQLETIMGLVEPGTTLGQAGQGVMRLFERATGTPVTGLADLQLNRETLDTVFEAGALDFLKTEEGQELILPSLRARYGLEPLEEVEAARIAEAELRLSNLRSILGDPELLNESVQRAVGRTPIQLRIPGDPDTFIDFNSEVAAQIYADLLQTSETLGLQFRQLNDEQMDSVIEDIQEAVRESNFSVSPAAIRGSVFPTYNRAIEAQNPGLIDQFLDNPNISAGEKLAMQYLVGSIGVGNDALIRETSPRMANFLLIAADLEERFGVERANEILPSVLQGLRLGGGEFPAVSDPVFFGPSVEVGGDLARPPSGFWSRSWRGLPFTGEGAGAQPDPGARRPAVPGAGGGEGTGGGTIDFSQIPASMLNQSIRDVLQSGEMTREEIIELAGQENFNRAVRGTEFEMVDAPPLAGANFPEGGFNPDSVPRPFREDVQRLNNLLRQRENTRSEVARANMTRVIQRLQERIRAGISAGRSGG